MHQVKVYTASKRVDTVDLCKMSDSCASGGTKKNGAVPGTSLLYPAPAEIWPLVSSIEGL